MLFSSATMIARNLPRKGLECYTRDTRAAMADPEQSRTIRFGLFELDKRTGELRKNGSRVKLQEQPL